MNGHFRSNPCEQSTTDGETPLLDGSVLSEAEKAARWDRALDFLAAAIADSIAEEILGAEAFGRGERSSDRPPHGGGAS